MASDILFRTAIASVNSKDRLRVYFQTTSGQIREAQSENGWQGGGTDSTIGSTKTYTPLAAAATSDFSQIHVFYLSSTNTILEQAYKAGRGWGRGDIPEDIHVAPYSKLAAAFHPGSDDDLQSRGWQAGHNLGKAMPGSAIAVTRFEHPGPSIRVYVQHDNHDIVQKCFDSNRGWFDMNQVIVHNAPIRTGFTVTSFKHSGSPVNLRLYWVNSDGGFWLWCWDSSGFRDSRRMTGSVIQGSEIAALCWDGSPPEIRVYYQGGTKVSGITEWVYGAVAHVNVGKTGKDPLPPA